MNFLNEILAGFKIVNSLKLIENGWL